MLFFILPACLLIHPSVDLKLGIEKHERALEEQIIRSTISNYFVDHSTMLSVVEERLKLYAPIVRRDQSNIQTDWIYSYRIVSGVWIPFKRKRFSALIHGSTFWTAVTVLETQYASSEDPSQSPSWNGSAVAYNDDLLSTMLLDAETIHLNRVRLQISEEELVDIAQKHLPSGFELITNSSTCGDVKTETSIQVSAEYKQNKIVQNTNGNFASFEQKEQMTLIFGEEGICQEQSKQIRFNDDNHQGEWQDLYIPDPRTLRAWLFSIINDSNTLFSLPPSKDLPPSLNRPLSPPNPPQ